MCFRSLWARLRAVFRGEPKAKAESTPTTRVDVTKHEATTPVEALTDQDFDRFAEVIKRAQKPDPNKKN